MSTVCPGLPYQEAIEPVNIVPIVDFIAGLCGNTFDTIIKVLELHPNSLISFSGPSRYAPRCKKHFIVPKCKTDRFWNNFIIRSCIDNIFTWSFSLFFIYLFLYTFYIPFCILFLYTFILTVLSFFKIHNSAFGLQSVDD